MTERCLLCDQPTPAPAIVFAGDGVECAACAEGEIARIEDAAVRAVDQVVRTDRHGMMVRGDDE